MAAAARTWELVAELPVQIDSYELQGLQAVVSSEFERKSTVLHMHGGGHEGSGEDVTYDAVDHDVLQATGAILPLSGSWTIGSSRTARPTAGMLESKYASASIE